MSSLVKSASAVHASYRADAEQARAAGDEGRAAELDSHAAAIEDALIEAVRDAVGWIESEACFVRTGHHSATTGEWRDGAGIVASAWLHTISWDGDPQLHVHLAILKAYAQARQDALVQASEPGHHPRRRHRGPQGGRLPARS